VLLGYAVLLGLGLFAVSPHIAGWMRIGSEEAGSLRGAFLLGSAAICCMIVNYVFQGLARGIQETAMVNASAFSGAVLAFAVNAALLLNGYGLWSIAAGLMARSAVTLAGSLYFLFFQVDREILRAVRIDRAAGMEFWRLSPPLFLSGLSFTLMRNSQVLIAGITLGPVAATVFGLTRKAADMAGTVLDAVGQASYGGFANLYATGDRSRSRAVYREVIAVYLAIGIALMCAYVAVNPGLVAVWAGAKMYGGTLLTVLMATGVLIGGWSYFTLSLYRSTDHHKQSSIALFLECLFRLPILLGLVHWIGLPGLPLGAMSTALVTGLWAHFRLDKLMPAAGESTARKVWAGRLAMISLGVLLCTVGTPASWAFVLLVGTGMLGLGAVLFLWLDPTLVRVRAALGRRFAGAR
jgi:O-antigen/teichoic acid export membrane protein